jgi:acetyl-CoA synthetase
MNFARDIVAARPPKQVALLELARDGSRREWTFGEVDAASGALAGHIARHGVGRGDVVLTLIGNRPEWVISMVACFRIGAVVLPCNEQLRVNDLRVRLDVAQPKLIIIDERNRAELEAAAPDCPVLMLPDAALFQGAAPAACDLDAEDPCLLTFTSGTEGEPKAVVHVQRYLPGQRTQAEHWLDVRPDDVVWCTAASGWS